MSHKKVKILRCLILCAAGAAALCLALRQRHSIGYQYGDIIMNVYILAQEERSSLEAKQTRPAEPPILYWNDTALPYDSKTNTCYLPLDAGEDWSGKLRTDTATAAGGYILCAAADPYWYQKEQAIRENHVFDLWLADKDSSIPLRLVFTGMPMVNIVTAQTREQPDPVTMDEILYGDELIYYGELTLLDPDRSGKNYTVTQSRLKYHLKGGSSSYFDKKSYSLTLLDESGENLKAPLLGMRKDDDWKLNALYTDPYRIREKTASQIWEKIDDANPQLSEAGPRMEYIEVVIDNEYLGLYTLTEPVDAKKCELEEQDILYKVADLYLPVVEELELAAASQWNAYQSVRIRYPKEISDYRSAWEPLKNYLAQIENITASHSGDLYGLLSLLDIRNVLDYLIFVQTVSASDNDWKNIYYAAHLQEDGEYKLIQHPWDLDYTFGNNFVIDEEWHPLDRMEKDHTILYPDITSAVLFPELFTTERSDPAVEASPRENSGASVPDGSANKEGFSGSMEDPDENNGWIRETSTDTNKYAVLLSERYKKYRADILSTESILQLMEENTSYLKKTGAALRESDRWPERKVNTNLTRLMAYQNRRMQWLDECLGNGTAFSPLP